jgi:hypothetical protein
MSFIIWIEQQQLLFILYSYFSPDGKRCPTFNLVEASVASVLENSF